MSAKTGRPAYAIVSGVRSAPQVQAAWGLGITVPNCAHQQTILPGRLVCRNQPAGHQPRSSQRVRRIDERP